MLFSVLFWLISPSFSPEIQRGNHRAKAFGWASPVDTLRRLRWNFAVQFQFHFARTMGCVEIDTNENDLAENGKQFAAAVYKSSKAHYLRFEWSNLIRVYFKRYRWKGEGAPKLTVKSNIL